MFKVNFTVDGQLFSRASCILDWLHNFILFIYFSSYFTFFYKPEIMFQYSMESNLVSR